MIKGKDSQGFTECQAFQNGLDRSTESLILLESNYRFNLFRHYTNRNLFMLRKGLRIFRLIHRYNRTDNFVRPYKNLNRSNKQRQNWKGNDIWRGILYVRYFLR